MPKKVLTQRDGAQCSLGQAQGDSRDEPVSAQSQQTHGSQAADLEENSKK